MTKKIAIVHDYLFQFGGAEKCLEKWLEMYPEAIIYTTFFIAEKFKSSELIQKAWQENRIKTTWIQKFFAIPGAVKFQKHLFWLYPLIMETTTIKDFDTVIISSTFCAKNAHFQNCKKIIYNCYTPTRFLHGQITETDLQTINPILRYFIPFFTSPLRWLDLRAVRRLVEQNCHWVTISEYIQKLTKQIYGVDSQIIFPPVELDKFLPIIRQNPTESFYFYLGRISFHKRVDLIIQACLELGRPLWVAGSSGFAPEYEKLQNIVSEFEKEYPEKTGLVKFLGRISDLEYRENLTKCKAFVFPPQEDFGITPVEAIAAGVPIIAFQAGGALEYVQENLNGVFFPEQTVESLKNAILKFEEREKWDTEEIKQSSTKFAEEVFATEFNKIVFLSME